MNESSAELAWLGALAKPVDAGSPQQLRFYGSPTTDVPQHDSAAGDPGHDQPDGPRAVVSVGSSTAAGRTGSTRRISAEQVDSVIALLDAVPAVPAQQAGVDVGLSLFGAKFDTVQGMPEQLAPELVSPFEADDIAAGSEPAQTWLIRSDHTHPDHTQTDQTRLGETGSDQTQTDQTRLGETGSDQTQTDQTQTDQTQTGLTPPDPAQDGQTRTKRRKRLAFGTSRNRFRGPLLIGVVGALALTVAGTSAQRTSVGLDKTGSGTTVLVGSATNAPAFPAVAVAPAGQPAVVLAPTGPSTAPNRVANRSRPIPIAGSVSGISLRTVRLTVAGKVATPITTEAKTVADLLAERKITLGSLDTVSPAPTAKLVDGLAIAVNRVVVGTTSSPVVLPQLPARTINDANLVKGSAKVVQQGKPGRELITYAVTTVNGKQTSKVITGKVTVITPTATITHLGTKSSFTYVGAEVFTNDTSFGVNWDGLAMCESTHNPQAINANPSAGLPTYGLFQFDLPTWASVGGSGNPIDASPEEQLMRAKLLFQQRGLEPWACRDAAH